jgi:hypothetical protein
MAPESPRTMQKSFYNAVVRIVLNCDPEDPAFRGNSKVVIVDRLKFREILKTKGFVSLSSLIPPTGNDRPEVSGEMSKNVSGSEERRGIRQSLEVPERKKEVLAPML